jgi:hypothetical protein
VPGLDRLGCLTRPVSLGSVGQGSLMQLSTIPTNSPFPANSEEGSDTYDFTTTSLPTNNGTRL